jgi:hypothetical protein
METNREPKLSTEQKVDAIYRLLKGDTDIDPKDEGLVGKVRKIRDRLYTIERWKTSTVSWAIGVSFGGGALVAFVLAVILRR